jgi:arylsulfatase A-like enzyme
MYNENAGGIFFRNSAERVYQFCSQWISQNKDKSFFLFLHTYQPHDPYFSPYPYNLAYLSKNAKWRYINLKGKLGGNMGIYRPLSPQERQNIIDLYDGEIKYVDEGLIKPLINKLKESKLYDQTMIIFTSDHGEEFFEHGGWEHGHNLYNESIRIPLIIKFPFSKFKGKKIKKLARITDIMPTILEELTIKYSKKKIDGRSLIPIIMEKEKKERGFISDIGRNILGFKNPRRVASIKGKYKIIFSEDYSKEDLNFFIYPPPSFQNMEVYNLINDFEEKNNLSSKNKELANQLFNELISKYLIRSPEQAGKFKMNENLKKQLKALGYLD